MAEAIKGDVLGYKEAVTAATTALGERGIVKAVAVGESTQSSYLAALLGQRGEMTVLQTPEEVLEAVSSSDGTVAGVVPVDNGRHGEELLSDGQQTVRGAIDAYPGVALAVEATVSGGTLYAETVGVVIPQAQEA